ncbi:transmembrane protein 184A [Dictyostelium discoideum AX4]|uniref:Transmembrane protein 184 homolog DDB_G0284525 n=1 Tax=Dictyostelium discoideum TaxID=44689 RepID=T1841_DICDI|nr:transmembrane protein 184A [Dictyostelium discoideum AX4]Q54PI4.1 RecName: Full=Transmembrane protein 184 homolog DDB_G0284525 [Dictyostelium discoideum]EAL65189.1 transmembrane protein 184A [Dictyostelium discoideum AX4]|eukprot:XP_638548.1 transmembrane protein 184A [Dictyostelium discoideum AX4]
MTQESSSSNHYVDESSFDNNNNNNNNGGEGSSNEILIRIPFLHDSVPALYAMFALASLFVLLATILSAHLIYKHLKYYTQPDHQRYIVRIVFMIPIYAIYSLLSLLLHNYQVYFALLRDCYEAYVLYMFFALCVSYGGGDKNLVTHFTSHPVMRLPMPLFFKFKPNEAFLQVCRMGMLQYVLVRPAVTLASAIFEIFGLYDEGSYAINRFYFYNAFIINVSVTVALYIVVLFYQAAAEELAPYKPLLKFTSIKIVVFFCFWQSIAISGMTNFGWIPTLDGWNSGEVSTGLQNFLICFEMFGVAILHQYAFPYELYRVRAFSAAPLIHRVEMGTVFKSVINSVSQKDMVKETVKSFKGTKITDGKTGLYSGLKDEVFNEFDIEEIEMGDFTSANDNNNFDDFDFSENNINSNNKDNNSSIYNDGASKKNHIGSAILAGGGGGGKKDNDLITDDDFFSLMNNDYANIDFSNFDQDALEEMNFDDDDDDMAFTARR